MTRRDFGSVRRLESGRFQARYVDRNAGPAPPASTPRGRPSSTWPRCVPTSSAAAGRTPRSPVAGSVNTRRSASTPASLKPTTRRQNTPERCASPCCPTSGYALEELTSARVRSWYAALARSTSATPDSAGVRARADGLEHAVDDDILLRNPCRFCGAGVARTAQRPIATLAQVEVLAEAVYPRYRALVLLAPGPAPAGTSSSRSPATGWTSRPGRCRSTGSTSCSPCKPYERACVEHGEGAEGGEPQSREREVGHVVRPQP